MGRRAHPPVLLAFHQVGKRTARTQIERVAELAREHWQGEWAEGGFRIYNGKMPIVATTLELLREHGPAGPAFRRFGRDAWQQRLGAGGHLGGVMGPAASGEEQQDRQVQAAQGGADGSAEPTTASGSLSFDNALPRAARPRLRRHQHGS
ncbi:hypothetical protein ACFUEN_35570 [Streptomyces griseorubiginosus]|uniref:hypothetical protein n=1 Tax=Streptomyces griseorubiginosus TaxID=67304 RepID=UPI0036411A72